MLMLVFAFLGCKKEFLDKKPNSGIVVPKSIEELQALLDNQLVMNLNGGLAQLSDDDYVIPVYNDYLALPDMTSKNAHIWNKEIYDGAINIQDWNGLYKVIFYANNVLNELKQNDYPNKAAHNSLTGSALFYRAYANFDLLSNFAQIYNPVSASTDLGIPIRLDPGIDYIKPRATVQHCYDQIIADLNTSIPLLNPKVGSANVNRPTRPAAFALLARIYLYMGDYELAEKNADSCLSLHDKLADYTKANLTSITPFGYVNDESIFYASQVNVYALLTASSATVRPYSINPLLIAQYDSSDLRSKLYFSYNANGSVNTKRRYTAAPTPFTGLATDEIYLIKSECLARKGAVGSAMDMLNKLLQTRYEINKYINKSASTKEEALEIVLRERRKELVWRGIRWQDIKRFNKEGRNIILNRTLNGTQYTLRPNDPRYVFPIPPEEIALSGIQQNER